MDGIEKYKITQYGKIAFQLRRGLINFNEAEILWNKIEMNCLDLQDLLKDNPDEFIRTVIRLGLESFQEK